MAHSLGAGEARRQRQRITVGEYVDELVVRPHEGGQR
jgi:hypothetical protein